MHTSLKSFWSFIPPKITSWKTKNHKLIIVLSQRLQVLKCNWGNSSEIKVTIDFRLNFVHWISIIWSFYGNFNFEIKNGGGGMLINSLLQVLCQCGRLKKRASDESSQVLIKFEPNFLTWLTNGKLEKTTVTVYLLFSLFKQFSAIEIRLVFSHSKLISSLWWLEKRVECPCSLVSLAIFSTDRAQYQGIFAIFSICTCTRAH